MSEAHDKECTCERCVMDCDCDFDPYEGEDSVYEGGDDDEGSFHFRRTCKMCGFVWWSFHCAHDGVQNPCGECGWRPPGTESPMEALGFAAPPGGTARLSLPE